MTIDDRIREQGEIIADLKTLGNANEWDLAWAMAKRLSTEQVRQTKELLTMLRASVRTDHDERARRVLRIKGA